MASPLSVALKLLNITYYPILYICNVEPFEKISPTRADNQSTPRDTTINTSSIVDMDLSNVTVQITQVLRSSLSRYQLQLLDHLVDIYRSKDTHEMIIDASVDRTIGDGNHHACVSLSDLTTSLAVLRLSIACCEERRTMRRIVDDK